MATTVSVDWDGSFLRIRYGGTFDRRDPNGSALNFLDLVAAHPEARRVMVDQRDLMGRPSEGELYFRLRGAPAVSVREYRIAVVEREDEREFGTFFENVVANLRPGLRVFYSEEEAIRWLSQG